MRNFLDIFLVIKISERKSRHFDLSKVIYKCESEIKIANGLKINSLKGKNALNNKIQKT